MAEILAHRGGSLNFPENTLAAFRGAAALGADGIECDVRAARDGELVLFHDSDTRRLTGEGGTIEERPWRAIRELRVLGREPVAHLRDLLEWLAARPDQTCYFDLSLRREEEVSRLVRAILEARLESRAFILTFAPCLRLLRWARRASPSARLAVMPVVPVRLLETARGADAIALCAGWNHYWGSRTLFRALAPLTGFAAEVARARSGSLHVTGGIANRPEDVRWFLEQGVQGVWTDDVRMAAQVRAAGEKDPPP